LKKQVVPKQNETDLQNQILHYLTLKQILAWKTTECFITTGIKANEQGKRSNRARTAGHSGVIPKEGRMLAIETKGSTSNQGKQETLLARLDKAGRL